MLSRREQVALICAAIYVVTAAVLAVVKISGGAWIQGVLWAVAAVAFGGAYGVSFVRRRRA